MMTLMPIFSKYLLGLIGLSLVLLPLASTRPTSLPAAVDDIEIDHVTLRIFERANIRPLGRWEPYQKYLKSLHHRPRILVSNDVPRSELSDGKYTFEQFGAEWEVPWSADDTKLGSGGIGTVYAGHYRRDGESQQRAVIKVASGGGFMRGAEVMKKLDSPRIMKALAFFRYQKSKPKNDFLVMPFYEHTSDAKAELNNGRLFEEAKWVACFQQLLQAIEVMHTTFDNDDKEGFAHGDIKPANILGIADGPGLEPTSYKLIDFDFAAPQSKDSKTGGGTVSFMSPEKMHFPNSEDEEWPTWETVKHSSQSSDVFSVGMVLVRFAFQCEVDDDTLQQLWMTLVDNYEEKPESLKNTLYDFIPALRNNEPMAHLLSWVLCGEKASDDSLQRWSIQKFKEEFSKLYPGL